MIFIIYETIFISKITVSVDVGVPYKDGYVYKCIITY